MSPAELSNALSMEQSSYWMSRVGEEDAVAPLLLGGAGITTPRRKGKKSTQDVGVMGSPSEVAVMKFISVFGWIDIRATMLLLGVSTRAHASRILNGLQKSSCLRAVTVPGSRHKVWLATSEGIDLFRIGGKPYEESKVGNSEFPHRVLVGYSGAVLMNGTFDILDIAGALDSGRVPGLVGRGSNGFEIVADRELRETASSANGKVWEVQESHPSSWVATNGCGQCWTRVLQALTTSLTSSHSHPVGRAQMGVAHPVAWL